MSSMRFEVLLEEIETLPPERQKTLVEIIRHRLAEQRREEIVRNAREARELFANGRLPQGTVEELMQGLDADEAV